MTTQENQPDSGKAAKYPPVELMHEWGLHACAHITGANPQIEYIARKACDWQREQDALLCMRSRYEGALEAEHTLHNLACITLASAIRSGASNV